MRTDHPAVAVCNLDPVHRWPMHRWPMHRWMEAPVQAFEPGMETCDHAVRFRPLDWDMVVRAAADRLSGTFCLPGPTDDPLIVGLAHELALLLCAYGRAGQEVDRMEATEPPPGP